MSQGGSLKLSINLNRGISSTTENNNQIDEGTDSIEDDIFDTGSRPSRPNSNESASSKSSKASRCSNSNSGRNSRAGPAPDTTNENGTTNEKELLSLKVPTASKNARKRKHIQTVFDDSKLLNQTALDAQRKEKERLERLKQLKQTVDQNDHIMEMAALPPRPAAALSPLPLLNMDDLEGLDVDKKWHDDDISVLGIGIPSTSASQVKKEKDHDHEIIDLSSDDEDDIRQMQALSQSARRIEPRLQFSQKRNKWASAEKDRRIFEEMDTQRRIEQERLRRRAQTGDIEKVELKGGQLIVNRGHPPNEPDIAVAPHLTYTLQPHQLGGIRFMYDNVVESIEEYRTSPGFGCILAHSMGLGKTIQVVTFTEIFFRATQAHKILVIVPINTIQNWLNEYEKWIPKYSANGERLRAFEVFILGDSVKTFDQRVSLVEEWSQKGGVLLIGYDMFRLLIRNTQPKKPARAKLNFVNGQKIQREEKPDDFDKGFTNGGRIKTEANQVIREALLDPGPDLVVCDEGHKIKNLTTDISMALASIRTTRRIVLTGYPLQNNLMEYYCMVDFVRPKYLGEKKSFSIMFEKPIKNGQCVDSTPGDIKMAMQRTHVLVEMLKGFVQRRTHHLLKSILPQSREYVLLLRKSPLQHALYRNFLIYANTELKSGNSGNVFNPLKAFAACSKIWNHPDVLAKTLAAKREQRAEAGAEKARRNGQMQVDQAGPAFPMQNHQLQPMMMMNLENAMNGLSNDPMSFTHHDLWNGMLGNAPFSADLDIAEDDDSSMGVANGKKKGRGRAAKKTLASALLDDPDLIGQGLQYDWAELAMSHHQMGNIEHGYKMKLAMEIIDETTKIGEKILLFSQNLTALDLIEKYLDQRKMIMADGTEQSWCKNQNYFRLDGSTNGADREKLINKFNGDPHLSLFLISTRAGSLGINLVSANRCIILDACWNPCHDAQAVCRVYRYGQQRKTFIYRLVMDNSMEKAIFNRQISKHGLQQRVVDDASVDANVTQKELETLLMYDEALDVVTDDWDTSSWGLEEEDQVLARVIERHSRLLSEKPFLHESLILEREDGLSEQEKMEAQLLYDREREAEMNPALDMFGGGLVANPSGGMMRDPRIPSGMPPWTTLGSLIQGGDLLNAPPPLRSTPMPHQLQMVNNNNNGFRGSFGGPSSSMGGGMGGGVTMSSVGGGGFNMQQPFMGAGQSTGYDPYNNNLQVRPHYTLSQMNGEMGMMPQSGYGRPPIHTFTDGTRSMAGLSFPGARYAAICNNAPCGSMQKIITDRDQSLPLLSMPTQRQQVLAGTEVILIRSGNGIYVKMLNGTLLDGAGSIYDTGSGFTDSDSSLGQPRSLHLPPPLLPAVRSNNGEPEVIELD